MKNLISDFVVIGSGIAGLNLALKAAKLGNVLIITKKNIFESNTHHAQGGIAAVLQKNDSFLTHIRDTITAGAGHNNPRAVEFMVRHGPHAIDDLLKYGVRFAKKDREKLDLTREGGHSQARIAFVGDYTGQEISWRLSQAVKKNPNIEIMENTFVTDLVIKNAVCSGVQIIKNHKIQTFPAKNVIIATGGIGNIYRYSTNPSVATGDGIAMGYLAGCQIKDMEFIQFHPTALNLPAKPRFLISEAVRGEGGILINSQKEAFMAAYHPLGDLAPRDIVARAIYHEEKKGPVFLDVTHLPPTHIKKRFPKIYQRLKEYDLDMTKKPIPITPAAHYCCGGIKTNFYGETGISHLYAYGEVTCTGVHGANRLASNSLLEALVFSNEIFKNPKKVKSFFKKQPKKIMSALSRQKPVYLKISPLNRKEINEIRSEIQKIMWRNVGIIRFESDLKKALLELKNLKKKIDFLEKKGINESLIETRNMAITALLITEAALKRQKSLGCHYIQG